MWRLSDRVRLFGLSSLAEDQTLVGGGHVVVAQSLDRDRGAAGGALVRRVVALSRVAQNLQR
jgi:hypothetical protein